MSFTGLIFAIKGGSGSGNHGHSGIPGKVGGSMRGNSSMSAGFSTVSEVEMIEHYKLDDQYAKHPDDFEALDYYISNAYADVNRQLRFGESNYMDNTITKLDKVINRAKRTPKDLVVMRRTGDEEAALYNKGKTVEDKGYVSTTIDTNATEGAPWVINILVPKGSKGVYASTYEGDMEKEFLLPRGSKFDVLDKNENSHIITAKLVK